jgi:hypothetical protein
MFPDERDSKAFEDDEASASDAFLESGLDQRIQYHKGAFVSFRAWIFVFLNVALFCISLVLLALRQSFGT